MRLRDWKRGLIPGRDVYVVLRHAPTGSPLSVALSPKYGGWGLVEALQGVAIDDFRRAMWGLGGQKGAPPKSILPWGNEDSQTDTETFVGDVMTLEQMDAWVERFRPTTAAEEVSDV